MDHLRKRPISSAFFLDFEPCFSYIQLNLKQGLSKKFYVKGRGLYDKNVI